MVKTETARTELAHTEAAQRPRAPRPAPSPEGATPVMAQYLEMKAAHPDELLFFRMGDFYELFFDDAVLAAEALGIALTKRGRHAGAEIPMCGVPIHNYERYLHDLVRAGFKVAVAEQIEDPAEARKRGAKSVVRRAVVRLVTAGTLTEDALLEGGRNNFLLAASARPGDGGLAWADLSTGVFRTAEGGDLEALQTALARLQPSEALLRGPTSPEERAAVAEAGAVLTEEAAARFRVASARETVCGFFGVADLEAFGTFTDGEVAAMGALIGYLRATQPGARPHLRAPRRETASAVMRIDAATRRNLELTRALDGGREGALLHAIDRTVSNAGARCLAERLAAPLTALADIRGAHDAVGFLLDDVGLREDLRAALATAPDLERALGRLQVGRGGPRDLAAIGRGLTSVGDAHARLGVALSTFGPGAPSALAALAPPLSGFGPLAEELATALVEEPPLRLSDGGAIAPGRLLELDEARALRDRSRQVIAELQTRYQGEAQIPSLKIKHNNLLGYFVETAASHAAKMTAPPLSDLFRHRQTMANAMRFTTDALSDLEARIARAGDQAMALEREAFDGLRERVLAQADAIAAAAAALAELDVHAALAELADREDYAWPEMRDDRAFRVEAGRHAVVEQALRRRDGGAFTANDVDLTADGDEAAPIWVVTGPNMAGKSTFLRQNALIAVLAQMGSFVPARAAQIGIVDSLFSRVGAADDLARGRSTFMVEMVETAAILNQAGPRALVILDEIGRGTATYDGLAIAWATLEHLEGANRCRALFATHYHELTTLAAARPAMRNVTVAVTEWNGEVVFLREIRPGAADRSYGVQVAALAGLPRAVVDRATALLSRLESADDGPAARAMRLVEDLPLFAAAARADGAASVGDEMASALRAAVDEIDPDALSPRDALDALYRLKALAADA